jgi:hypothetical protein
VNCFAGCALLALERIRMIRQAQANAAGFQKHMMVRVCHTDTAWQDQRAILGELSCPRHPDRAPDASRIF